MTLQQLLTPPIFIIGTARSGTTWAYDILTAHPQVAGVFESWMFTQENGLAPLFSSAHWPPKPSGLGYLLGRDDVLAAVRQLAAQMMSHAIKPEHRFLVEKSPSHAFTLPIIAELFPGARFIHVIRDGRDVCVSVKAAVNSWMPSWKSSFGRSLYTAARNWHFTIRRARRDALPFAAQVLEIRYEAMRVDPMAAYRQLFDFCTIPYDETLLQEIHRKTDFDTNYKNDRTGFRRGGRVGDWHSDFNVWDAYLFDLAAGETLVEMGYEADRSWWWRRALGQKRPIPTFTIQPTPPPPAQPFFVPALPPQPALPKAAPKLPASRVAWPQKGQADLQPFQIKQPGNKEILILTQATLVSAGTERAMFTQQPNAEVRYPAYPGYSGAGQVVMVGEGVTRFKVGDLVAGKIAHASLTLLKEDQVVRIPNGLTMPQAAFYRLGVIALQGIRRARIEPGDAVAVFGPGLIGQLVIQLAAVAGANPITAVSATPRRLPLAQQSGAHHTLCLADGVEALEAVQSAVTIEVSGNPEAIHHAIRCTRPGGRIVLLGSNRGVTQAVDFEQLRQKQIELIGAHITALPRTDRSPLAWPETKEGELFLNLLAEGRINVDALLTDELSPTEAGAFYGRLAHSEANILAAIFHWDTLPSPPSLPAPRSSSAPSLSLLAPLSSPPSPRPLRFALIGCGEIGVRNAQAIRQTTAATLVAAMDVNSVVAADLGERFKVPHTTQLEELLQRPDVDAVLIATPHYLHAPLTIQAAQAGKHVLVEKPMSTTLTDADAMLAACKTADVKLGVFYCYRNFQAVQLAKSLIEQGGLGQLLGVSLVCYIDKSDDYWTGGQTGRVTTDWRLSWEKSGGGVLMFNLVHYLDMLRYLTNQEVETAYSDYGTFDSPSETEDTISITLRYGNGMMGNITAVSCMPGANTQEIRIWGTQGQLLLSPQDSRFYTSFAVDGYSPEEWHPLPKWQWGEERRNFIQEFATAVLQNQQPPVDGENGRVIQAITQAIYAAKEAKRTVRVGESTQ